MPNDVEPADLEGLDDEDGMKGVCSVRMRSDALANGDERGPVDDGNEKDD